MKYIKRPWIQTIVTLVIFGAFAAPTNAQTGNTQTKAGVGFVFGTTIQQHQKSNFKQGVGSYFRLNLLAKDKSGFFIHTEQAGFNAEEGDATATGTKSIQGIGASLPLGSVSMEVVVGTATVAIAAGAGTAPAAIALTNSTDPMADIAVKWNHQPGNLTLGVGLAYRLHRLSTGMAVTDSAGTTTTIYDMGSNNITIDIGYNF